MIYVNGDICVVCDIFTWDVHVSCSIFIWIYRCIMLYIHTKIYMKLYMYYVVHLHEDILCSDSLQLSRPRSDVKAKSHSTVPASPAKRDGVRQGVVRCLRTSKGHLRRPVWRHLLPRQSQWSWVWQFLYTRYDVPYTSIVYSI